MADITKQESEETKQVQAPVEVAAPATPAVAAVAERENVAVAEQVVEQVEEDEDNIEADTDSDSAYGGTASDGNTSISSSVLRGYYENGRRYQSVRDSAVNFPSDHKQFASMEAAHLTFTILEEARENPHFRAPVSKDAQHILDLGTGTGVWANDVADMFPNITVHGIDLYPPPTDWVAPNCILEVDDMTRPFTWGLKFDLIHMRLLVGNMPRAEFQKVYKRAYDNLQPGGWIEHVDVDVNVHSTPSRPLPPSALLTNFGSTLIGCGHKAGVAADIADFMRSDIEAAGFINVHEKKFQMPIGGWPRHPVYKDAGTLQMANFKAGLEGWFMWFLTKFGSPEPWSPEEVQVYLAMMRNELDQGYHIFQYHKRVWAQKPYDA